MQSRQHLYQFEKIIFYLFFYKTIYILYKSSLGYIAEIFTDDE